MADRAPIYQDFNSIINTAINRCYYHDYSEKPHYHLNPELIYVSSGCMNVIINATNKAIEAGQFCLILPWQFHSFETPNTSDSVIIVFPTRYIQLFVTNMSIYGGYTQVFSADPAVKSLFMEYLYDSTVQPDEYIFMSVLYGLCHCFLRQSMLENAEQPPDDSLVVQVMNYVSTHLQENLSLQAISELFGYNYYYLSRLFRKNTGLSFHLFCNIKKVESATTLLEETKLTASEIAWRCGFHNIRTFNRVFSQLVGQSPKSYRNERFDHSSSMTVYKEDLHLSTEFIGKKKQ